MRLQMVTLTCCAQIENEFGFIGPDETYMRHITKTAKNALRDEVILFTTDPPDKAPRGTLKGGELFTCAPLHLCQSMRGNDTCKMQK